uniref:PDZ domain-containing protein n=1 Tax=Heterorhabditis bacteriophora TaxID=37862 RepID=A0A1I7WP42_HETBA
MRGSGKSAKPITVIPDIPYKKVELKLRLKEWHERDHGIELNDNLMICGLTTAIAKQELIAGKQYFLKLHTTTAFLIGDRITKINGSSVKNKAEAMKVLGQCGGEESKDPVSSFGFTLKLLKNRAHVIALDPKGIASIYFCLGDALLDLDGTAIPFNDLEFVRSYTLKFNKNGKFSVVVERPITPNAVNLYNLLFKCMLPQESDVDMGPDAVLIGKVSLNCHIFKYLFVCQETNSMELKIASDVEDDIGYSYNVYCNRPGIVHAFGTLHRPGRMALHFHSRPMSTFCLWMPSRESGHDIQNCFPGRRTQSSGIQLMITVD